MNYHIEFLRILFKQITTKGCIRYRYTTFRPIFVDEWQQFEFFHGHKPSPIAVAVTFSLLVSK